MASSRKSSSGKRPGPGAADLAARVAVQIKDIVKPSDHLVVGLSGGVDSVVLLDGLQRAARTLRFRLSALHVNHQLSPSAGRWLAFCRRLCRERGIPFQSASVKVRRGDSLEAAARAARYAVFSRQRCDYIVLAHHRDDQVETLFLQLLRGAGVRGLAAMPLVRHPSSFVPHPSSLRILRPLLDVTRQEILDYAKKRRLKWIEDESNQDIYFQRNFLRHEVLPVIARRFPAYRATVARSARHLAEAARLLDEVAAADGAGRVNGGALEVAALRRLAPARARNLLRYFLGGHGVSMPATERLEEALRQSLGAKQDARVKVDLGAFELHRFQGRLHVVPRFPPVRQEYTRRWRGERMLALRELGGVLVMTPSRGQGVSRERLRGGTVTIRVRRGGERLQPDRRRPRRSLKNLLQEARVPPWQRGHMPLIFCGVDLVWAAGIGVDCKYQASDGEPAIRPVWNAAMRRPGRR
ncbi:MAG: tRNA lysidine(34) synthetase TilS [Betaproteobacteria bacterium RIFCSPLOWO2_02_FULL_67_26]|nr:MAG: tRNA lysidine(34) synthetase TilS [Betaproteobacteria bacterium RIFCSPLOWO2_02_FULL_67_26]